MNACATLAVWPYCSSRDSAILPKEVEHTHTPKKRGQFRWIVHMANCWPLLHLLKCFYGIKLSALWRSIPNFVIGLPVYEGQFVRSSSLAVRFLFSLFTAGASWAKHCKKSLFCSQWPSVHLWRIYDLHLWCVANNHQGNSFRLFVSLTKYQKHLLKQFANRPPPNVTRLAC